MTNNGKLTEKRKEKMMVKWDPDKNRKDEE